MAVDYKYLDWDSQFFGYSIGTASISELKKEEWTTLLNDFIKMNFKLVYLYPLDDESLLILRDSNIPQVDNKITFVKKIDQNYHTEITNVASYTKKTQFNKIIELALTSGEYSRFKTDKNFKNREFEKLYTEWIKSSINKRIADDVLVYELTDGISGFVTYRTEQKKIVIGLIAVDENYKGKGIGKSLMYNVENIAIQNHIEKIEISTQEANINAVKFYKHI